jgi:hypothetical protein
MQIKEKTFEKIKHRKFKIKAHQKYVHWRRVDKKVIHCTSETN